MIQSQTRRPRFERAPARNIQITSRDLEILRAVGRHRLLRSTQIETLIGGSRQVLLRRLQLLFHHGCLDRPTMQLNWYTRGSEPMVYALGNRGAMTLKAIDGLSRGGSQRNTKNRNLSRFFLHHTLLVAEVMVAFEAACRTRRNVRLIRAQEVLRRSPHDNWQRGSPFRWQVDATWKGMKVRLGVEPDGVLGLDLGTVSEKRKEDFFFLEADRGTMPVERRGLGRTSMLRKFVAYQATWRAGTQQTQLGIQSFRVLTVTTNRERMARLIRSCGQLAGGLGLFLFTDRRSLVGSDILTVEWVNGRGEPVTLASRANSSED